MAKLTKIKMVTNNSLYAIQLIDGENSKKDTIIDTGGGWEGKINVPWASNTKEIKDKGIQIISDGRRLFYIFQDYQSDDNRIRYTPDGTYPGEKVEGKSKDGGTKTLSLTSSNELRMHDA